MEDYCSTFGCRDNTFKAKLAYAAAIKNLTYSTGHCAEFSIIKISTMAGSTTYYFEPSGMQVAVHHEGDAGRGPPCFFSHYYGKVLSCELKIEKEHRNPK